MATAIDDLRRGSHAHMAEHLTAPLEAGARSTRLPIAANGDVVVDWTTRHPVLAIAPAEPLEDVPWAVELRPAGVTTPIVLRFAPYTEEEAFLAGVVPSVDNLGQATQFTVNVKLRVGGTLAPQASVPARLHAEVLEGITAKMLLLLSSEKGRIRRQGREIAAQRFLSRARDDALDRLGGEVAVPRFSDRLEYKAGALVSTAKREPDADYRRRIGLYRRSFLRTPGEIDGLLNGPGAANAPNAGAIGVLADKVPAAQRSRYQNRFLVDERGDELAVAIQLVAAGDVKYRNNFLEFVRAVHLIWPRQTQQADAVHEARYLPRGKPPQTDGRYDREQRLREELRKLFTFSSLESGPDAAIAAGLAEALVRTGRCVKALGGPVPMPVFRCQRGDRGSRYELGLGVDLKRLTGAELAAMRTQHAQLKAADPEFGQIQDPYPADKRVKGEIRGLLKSMDPATATVDPDGRWLFEPCGLKTVHRLPQQSGAPWPVTYVSHFPVHGMVIDQAPASALPVGGWTELVGGFFGQGDFDSLVAYEREPHAAQVWSTPGDGTLTGLTRDTGWQATVARLAVGDFVGRFEQNVVAYHPSSQELTIHDAPGGDLETQPSRRLQNVGANWTHVTTVSDSIGGHARSQAVLYDQHSGDLLVYEVKNRHVGDNVVKLGEVEGWRAGWTHVVGMRTPAGAGVLFCYDRRRQEAGLFRLSSEGEPVEHGKPLYDLGNWTHVVAGSFGPYDGDGLVLFDRDSGLTELRDSNLRVLRRHRKWPRTTSEVIAGNFTDGDNDDVIVYERMSGHASVWQTDEHGGMTLLRDSNTFPRSPGHEVVARFHAPGDPGTSAVLADGLAKALAAWTDAAQPAWTVLSRAQTEAAWQQSATLPPSHGALQAFAKAGLPAVPDPALLFPKLMAIEPTLVAAIRLDAAQASSIVAGNASAEAILRGVAGVLASERLTSALPLVTSANEVVIVVGAVPLPEAGTNLYEAPSTGFRWYVVPIEGAPGAVRATGAKTEYAPAEPGLCALVAVGYRRRDGTEPYEFRVGLPAGALLTFEQYEWLMNLLGHAYPAGVRVNTWSIRQQHVDLKVDGSAAPLDPTISRTYRAFRRRRQRGLSSVTLDDES